MLPRYRAPAKRTEYPEDYHLQPPRLYAMISFCCLATSGSESSADVPVYVPKMSFKPTPRQLRTFPYPLVSRRLKPSLRVRLGEGGSSPSSVLRNGMKGQPFSLGKLHTTPLTNLQKHRVKSASDSGKLPNLQRFFDDRDFLKIVILYKSSLNLSTIAGVLTSVATNL